MEAKEEPEINSNEWRNKTPHTTEAMRPKNYQKHEISKITSFYNRTAIWISPCVKRMPDLNDNISINLFWFIDHLT